MTAIIQPLRAGFSVFLFFATYAFEELLQLAFKPLCAGLAAFSCWAERAWGACLALPLSSKKIPISARPQDSMR
jgi:hypothetical protein